MKAMILAAGRGERMRPLTDTCPKPLLIAGGKPLIVHHIERLVAAGLDEIVINHAHLGHMIEATLGDGQRFGARIDYSPETHALETAGGIRQALAKLGEAPFLVVNGDIYCELDLAEFVSVASRQWRADDLAHLLLVPNPEHHPGGDFALDGHRACPPGGAAPCLTFAGIGLYRPALFATLTVGARAALGPLLRAALANQRVSAHAFAGFWIDVGTPARLATLDHRLSRLESST